jgi:hypothetical protein
VRRGWSFWAVGLLVILACFDGCFVMFVLVTISYQCILDMLYASLAVDQNVRVLVVRVEDYQQQRPSC